MRVLLDTHALLWWINGDSRLSDEARRVISDPASDVYVSAASAWEMAIKASLGRIDLSASPGEFLLRQLAKNEFQCLPVHLNHACGVHALPRHHRDPFDRLLIAQSQIEGMPIITSDAQFAHYPVKTIW